MKHQTSASARNRQTPQSPIPDSFASEKHEASSSISHEKGSEPLDPKLAVFLLIIVGMVFVALGEFTHNGYVVYVAVAVLLAKLERLLEICLLTNRRLEGREKSSQ